MTGERDTSKTPETSSENESHLGRYSVELYRGWHQIETSEHDVIDFDLVNEDFTKVAVGSRREAIDRLEDLSQQIDPTTPFLEFLKARVVSSLTYAKALEGEVLPFDEYCLKTVGIKPELISEEDLDRQKERVHTAFSEIGYRPRQEEYIRFFSENLLTKDEIARDFNNAKERFTPIVVSTLGLEDLLPLDYHESFENRDAYWICWISGNRSGIDFRINLHERNKQRWFKGNPELLAIHEMDGHLLQVLKWRDNVAKKLINPGYGTSLIPGPEQWACEGMADTLAVLIPELYQQLSNFGKFGFEIGHLSDLVFNNVHILVNNRYNLSQIKDFVRTYLPQESDERIEKTVEERSTKPYYRAYLMTYCNGGHYFYEIARQLGDKSIDLLRALYDQPMIPDQIKNLGSALQVF